MRDATCRVGLQQLESSLVAKPACPQLGKPISKPDGLRNSLVNDREINLTASANELVELVALFCGRNSNV